jgi:hypothetical protein
MSVASSGGQTGRVTLAELGRVTIAWDDTDPWQQDFSILVVPTGHRADDLDGSFARALADRLGPQGWAAFKDAARAAAANSPHYGPDAPILFRAPKAALLGRMHRYYVLITVFSSPRHPVSMKQVIAGLIYLLGDERPLALPMVLMPIPGAGDGGLQLEEPIAQCLAQLHRMRAILRKTPRAEFVFTSRQELNIPRLRGISDGLESLAEIYSPWPECDKVVRWAIRLAERLIYRTTLGADLVVSASDLLTALVYASKSKECSAYFKQPYKNILARFAKGWITATVDDYLSKPVIESGEVVFGSLRPWMAHAMGHAKESGRKLITVVDLILTMDPAIEVKGVDLLTLRSDVARAWEAENQKFDLTDIKVEGEEVTFDPEVTATLEEMVQSSSTPPPEPPPPLNTLRITSFNSDDIDGPDLLGVDRDAKAFADLICLRAAKPPLSIGLFGNWGSGKSFFMGRIKQNIKNITAEARHTENSPFCGTVVPIHFNAWHYVEQNLWASLVHHIFQELDGWIRREQEREQAQTQPDKLFERLATARRLTFEALEELVTLGLVAQKAEEEARAARDQHRKEVGQQRQLTAGDMTGVIRKAFETELSNTASEGRKALDTLAQSLGVPNLHERTAEIMELWRSGHRMRERADVLLRALWRSTRTRDLAVLAGLLVAVPLGIAVGQSLLADMASWPWLRDANLALGQTVAAGAALLWQAKSWIDKARPVLGKLDTVRAQLDGLASKTETEHLKKVAAVEAAAEQSRLALQDSERRLNRAQETLAAAEHAFAAQSTAGRLTRFIRERAGGGDYSRHLTLVATIRKDFQSLSDLMRMNEKGGDRLWQERLHRDSALFAHKLEDLLEQHQNRLPASVIDAITQAKPSNVAEDRDYPVFDRIVLYIDDLDRCPPEKVVEVLQAVHLLLAFDLFVVVVAVDVRWVEQSLERTYAGMLTGKGGRGGEMASPRDYLEKIFQIPFWVEPMDGDACSRFLTGLMDRIAEGDQVSPRLASGPPPISPTPALPKDSGPGPAPAPKGPQVDETEEDVPGPSEDEDVLEAAPPDDEPVRPEPAPVRPAPAPQTLVLSPLSAIDRAEIAAIAPLLGGVPRRMKRFLNVYQLLKTQVNAMALTDELPDQRALAIGLAIWQGFTITEMEQTHEAATITDMVAALARGGPRFHALLLERTKIAGLDLEAPGVKDLFALIVELAQRFSFNGPGDGLLPVVVQA